MPIKASSRPSKPMLQATAAVRLETMNGGAWRSSSSRVEVVAVQLGSMDEIRGLHGPLGRCGGAGVAQQHSGAVAQILGMVSSGAGKKQMEHRPGGGG